MSDPLVSVCIGSYNRESLIRETIESVRAQTYSNYEIIVADNASTDRTAEIAESLGARVLRRDTNSGLCSTTRNAAAGAARGDYIAFVDSDDAWYPDKLRRQVDFMQAHPDIPLSHTRCHLMDGESKVWGIRHEGRALPSGRCFSELLRHCWITISSVMVRRSLYAELGPFNEGSIYGKLGEDWEFFLKTAARHEIGFIDEILVKYRKSPTSITYGNWRATPEAVPFSRLLVDREDIWGGVASREEVRTAFLENCHANADYWFHQGRGARSTWFAWQALCASPLSSAGWKDLAKGLARSFS